MEDNEKVERMKFSDLDQEHLLADLNSISKRMKFIGSKISLLFFSQVIYPMLYYSFIRNYRFRSSIFDIFQIITPLVVLFILIFAIRLILAYRNLRIEGIIIFEEISDEIQWNDEKGKNKAIIGIRVILKDFVRNSGLFPFKTESQYLIAILIVSLISFVTLLEVGKALL